MFERGVALGSILAAAAVLLGAFGSHVLKGELSDADLATFQTGVQYHMIHALGIIIASIVAGKTAKAGRAIWACRFFTAGIVLFSVSLYVLSIAGVRQLGAVAPLGGASFMIGWILLAGSAFQRK